jgi:hypothetical protein
MKNNSQESVLSEQAGWLAVASRAACGSRGMQRQACGNAPVLPFFIL